MFLYNMMNFLKQQQFIHSDIKAIIHLTEQMYCSNYRVILVEKDIPTNNYLKLYIYIYRWQNKASQMTT